jgi:hypothetical protein
MSGGALGRLLHGVVFVGKALFHILLCMSGCTLRRLFVWSVF